MLAIWTIPRVGFDYNVLNLQAKGTDYTRDSVPEAALMRSLGGKVVITGDPKDHSTTSLIAKVKKAFK